MEGIGDQGLFIIAALVIAFINWLSATLKKKQASRKEDDPQDAQALQRDADEEAQALIDYDSWPSPDDEPNPEATTASSPSIIEEDPNQNIRDFFAALSGSPPVKAPPVPITELEQAPPVPQLPVESPSNASEVSSPVTTFSYPTSGNQSSLRPIINKLRQDGGAREAFIFSEILGKPKSLRQSGS